MTKSSWRQEQLAIGKARLGDMLLSTVTRETIEGFQSCGRPQRLVSLNFASWNQLDHWLTAH